MSTGLPQCGWRRFAAEPEVLRWVASAQPAAEDALADPQNAAWWRCSGTWFVGVNLLPNDRRGALPGGPPLGGAAVRAAAALVGGAVAWDRAQISVIRPGYPRQGREEAAPAFAYRKNRDAAHLDGLLPVGPDRRRMIREPHAFILGLPLTDTPPEAAPLVVWEGSQHIMRAALAEALAPHDPATWADVDVTDAYQAARRRVFESCPKVAVHARPGESYLIHRLALHGVAPWRAKAAPEDRKIAYFRPPLPSGSVAAWLDLP